MAPYVFRAYAAYDVRPSDDWSTILEHEVDVDIDSPVIQEIADSMVAGLQEIYLNNVFIDRVAVSTWVADSEPYDPGTVRSISYGVSGLRPFLLTNPVADDLTLFIRKGSSEGRNGKMQLRGTLTIADVTSESGSWVIEPLALSDYLSNVEAMATIFGSVNNPVMIGVSLLDTVYPAVGAGVKQVPVKVYSETPYIRFVESFTLVGPRTRQVSQ